MDEDDGEESQYELTNKQAVEETKTFLKHGKSNLNLENYRTIRRVSHKQVYVTPIFEKPGRHYYIVKAE